jgi:hypothetical protein
VKEKFCEETPSEAEEVVDPRYTSRYTIAIIPNDSLLNRVTKYGFDRPPSRQRILAISHF